MAKQFNIQRKKPKIKKDGTPKKSGGSRPNAGRKKSKIKRYKIGHAYVTEQQARDWGMGDLKRGIRNIRILVQDELDKLDKPF